MPNLLVNIDVPDLERGVAFYTAAFGLRVGKRFHGGFVELRGGEAPIYLLEKQAGTVAAGSDVRRYKRHWSPMHLDFAVEDQEGAIARAVDAGATREGDIVEAAYGRLAMFADPFGHGFCLIAFNEQGYDALPTVA